ncbi:MAG TPA: hypothetical protein VFG04_08120 [Planctomycetaceae bacterium]|jgi:hypothetical protein|nr:hypothetical protein [Planctomycetaceae bacterium]
MTTIAADRAQPASVGGSTKYPSHYYCAGHESGHITSLCQIGRADLIRGAEVFDEPKEFPVLGWIRAAAFYHEGVRDLAEPVQARLIIAGLSATTLLFDSSRGCGPDLAMLADGGAIHHIPPLHDVDNWRHWETEEIRALRAPVEAELREDLSWVVALADRLVVTRKLNGDEIRQAWSAYRAGVSAGEVFDL